VLSSSAGQLVQLERRPRNTLFKSILFCVFLVPISGKKKGASASNGTNTNATASTILTRTGTHTHTRAHTHVLSHTFSIFVSCFLLFVFLFAALFLPFFLSFSLSGVAGVSFETEAAIRSRRIVSSVFQKAKLVSFRFRMSSSSDSNNKSNNNTADVDVTSPQAANHPIRPPNRRRVLFS